MERKRTAPRRIAHTASRPLPYNPPAEARPRIVSNVQVRPLINFTQPPPLVPCSSRGITTRRVVTSDITTGHTTNTPPSPIPVIISHSSSIESSTSGGRSSDLCQTSSRAARIAPEEMSNGPSTSRAARLAMQSAGHDRSLVLAADSDLDVRPSTSLAARMALLSAGQVPPQPSAAESSLELRPSTSRATLMAMRPIGADQQPMHLS